MGNYEQIIEKLNRFIRKYYLNEIIRGSILFLALGLVYGLFTLLVEHTLWLDPFGRTLLFWFFILAESALLVRFVIIPVMRLLGLRHGISKEEASLIIGRHFKEVEDKLLNVVQLGDEDQKTELIEASIDQKSIELKPIRFRSAIDLRKNSKHLKYLIIPLVLGLGIWLTGNSSLFTQSLNRVVHHQTVFLPPAPFSFKILNKELKALEDGGFTLRMITDGEVEPEIVQISYSGENHYVRRNESGEWEHEFQYLSEDIEFELQGNEVRSIPYTLEVIRVPKITDFSMKLIYPDYLGREEDRIENTGNAEIPEGTKVVWEVSSSNVKSLRFGLESGPGGTGPVTNEEMDPIDDDGTFTHEREIRKDTRYRVTSSNESLEDFETLRYELRVVKDEYPKIFVRSDMDSLSLSSANFAGQLTDDHGLSRLQVVARNLGSDKRSIGQIEIGRSDFEEFYYMFPGGIILEEGEDYEVFFEVFDNDAVNGAKRTVSESFFFTNRSQKDIDKTILKEQEKGVEEMRKAGEDREELQKNMEEFSKKLKSQENVGWEDQKELKEFLERQRKYREMMDRNSEKMLKNLQELDEEDHPELNEMKQALEDRWEEMNETKSKEELLRELEELAEKLEKEDLIERVDRLKEQNKQEKRSLERILELTKQFYVEKKSVRIMEELKELSEDQMKLASDESNDSDKQDLLNKRFDSIQKEFEELREQNEELKNPMPLLDSEADEKLIKMEMREASEELEKSESGNPSETKKASENAVKKQKSAARKMQELSKSMESGMMAMQMQGVEENIEDLKQILKNLILFSEDQEDLMMDLSGISDRNAEFPALLKEQVKLKEYFEHIDDSLYALSIRMVTLTSEIEEDLTDAHYNLDKSLENLSDNRVQQGRSNQQYTMTAANNLAAMLSDMLKSLQNQQPGSGQGSGEPNELSLPDIIKQQQGLSKQMEEGMKQGKSEGKPSQEEMSGEQFELYKQQQRLREQLQNLIQDSGGSSNESQKALKSMEELERLLLEKGVTRETLDRMQRLEYELLELENASMKKKKDFKREATTNKRSYESREMDRITWEDLFGSEKEQLRRENIKLNPEYQKRVKVYFEERKDSI